MKRALLVTLFFLGSVSEARAGDFDWEDEQPPEPPRPARFLIEVKFGSYTPNIDSTTGLSGTPFSDLFTDQFSGPPGRRPGHRLLTTVEFDWEFFHKFGALGVGGSMGFQRRQSHSFEFPPTTDASAQILGPGCVVFGRDPAGGGCVRSSDNTVLSFIPLALQLVYRFDVLMRYKVPFVPYVKAGFTYYFWWIQHFPGTLSSAFTVHGKTNGIGGTAGLIAQPGLALALDMLNPSAARTLDAEIGIHHTYVFAELNYAWVTGLGLKDKMVFSDVSWNAGISFEF